MQFVRPEFLYAFFALLIPVIVHLFQLRRFKKQEFTNLAFLETIKLQSRKSSIIKKWLILCTRLLALSCIILAFAQPYFSKQTVKGTTPEIVIYLDNSFSMQALGAQGILLERSVQELLTHLKPSAEIDVFTNTKTYRNRTAKSIQNELLDIDYTAYQLDLKTILSKGKMMFSKSSSNPKFFIVISDFQQTKNPLTELKKDPNYQLIFVQQKPINIENNFIKHVEISPQSNEYKLSIKASSNTSTKNTLTLSFYNNQKLLGKSTLEKSKNYKTTIVVPKQNLSKAKLVLEDNGLNFDDTFYFSISSEKQINVLTIGKNFNTYLPRIFTADEFSYSFQNIASLGYSAIQKQDLIILDALERIPGALQSSLKSFLKSDGKLIVIPSENAELSSYNSLFDSEVILKKASSENRITDINFDHPIYQNIFEKKIKNFQFPKVKTYYPLKTTSNTLLGYQNNEAFLAQYDNIFIFSSNISGNESNFINSPLVVPTFYSIGTSSFKIPKTQYTIGDEHIIESKYSLNKDEVLRLSKDDMSFIPLQRKNNAKLQIITRELPIKAGHYALHHNTDTLQYLSYNFRRNESILNYMNLETFAPNIPQESIKNSLAIIKSSTNTKPIWKWFVTFAIIFLAIEMLILKFFK